MCGRRSTAVGQLETIQPAAARLIPVQAQCAGFGRRPSLKRRCWLDGEVRALQYGPRLKAIDINAEFDRRTHQNVLPMTAGPGHVLDQFKHGYDVARMAGPVVPFLIATGGHKHNPPFAVGPFDYGRQPLVIVETQHHAARPARRLRGRCAGRSRSDSPHFVGLVLRFVQCRLLVAGSAACEILPEVDPADVRVLGAGEHARGRVREVLARQTHAG